MYVIPIEEKENLLFLIESYDDLKKSAVLCISDYLLCLEFPKHHHLQILKRKHIEIIKNNILENTTKRKNIHFYHIFIKSCIHVPVFMYAIMHAF